jgi:hypothetical protein
VPVLIDDRLQLPQQLEAAPRDRGAHHAPVLPVPPALDQPPRRQAVEQPGDVRLGGDHAGADLRAGQAAAVPGPAQDAQNVVLGEGDAPGAQGQLQAPLQQVRGADEIEQRLLLGALKGPRLLNLSEESAHRIRAAVFSGRAAGGGWDDGIPPRARSQ